jgi:hypothetical protein
MVESLRRLVDPVAVKHEELSRKAEREQPRPETAGDPPSLYRCRVGGETGSDGWQSANPGALIWENR